MCKIKIAEFSSELFALNIDDFGFKERASTQVPSLNHPSQRKLRINVITAIMLKQNELCLLSDYFKSKQVPIGKTIILSCYDFRFYLKHAFITQNIDFRFCVFYLENVN